jgi:Integrase core domain/leucine-zipper of insertion element IS481
MNAHKNARTTPFGRAVMVRRVLEEGWSVAAVAATFEVSTRTVRMARADEKRQSVTGFLVRALRWFRRQGIRVERVMTDNGSGYVSRLFRKACRRFRLRHLRTRPPTRPRPPARPSASSRPSCVNGPMPCRTAAQPAVPPICPDGCATTTSSDPMLASLANHPPPGSRRTPEQPASETTTSTN